MSDFLAGFLTPYPILLVVMALALASRFWKRGDTRRSLLLVIVPFVALVLLSTQPIEHLLLGTLEWQNRPLAARPDNTQAIVVLASAARPPNRWRLQAELDDRSIYRCLCAKALYHQGKACPVLLSGGMNDPSEAGPPNATVMRDFLVDLGVKESDLIVEDVSRSTYENAVECHKLLQARGITRIVLVTDAVHMVRAAASFRRLALEVVPAACHHQATTYTFDLAGLVPDPNCARNCQRVWHEWVGLAWYWIRGRI
jgi:uncharacterized SAM-binding protein YcdF (DUF218 family)